MDNKRIHIITGEIADYEKEIRNFEISEYPLKEKKLDDFLTLVTDFLNYIFLNQETKYIFNSLLENRLSSREKSETDKSNGVISKYISAIIGQLEQQKNWADFCDHPNNQEWANPVKYTGSSLISLKDLVNYFKSISIKDNSIEKTEEFQSYMFDDPNGIFIKYIDFDKDNTLNTKKIPDISSQIGIIKEIWSYNQRINGNLSAIKLTNIYGTYHPNPKEHSLGNKIIIYQMKSRFGYNKEDIKEIKDASTQIKKIICNKLLFGIAKELLIDRYVSFCELYDKETLCKIKDDELKLHNHFDKFAYISGFFPLSEPKLERGYADVIATNSDQAILIETKIYNSSSQSKNVNSQLQIRSYYNKLKTFPHLSRNVYILIYSGKIIETDDIQYKDLNIIFKTINLSETTPSNLRKKDVVSLEPDFFVKK